eukprot:gene13069-14414_t
MSAREFKNVVTTVPNTLPEHVALDWFFEYIDEDVKDPEVIGDGWITAFMMFSTGRISKSQRQDKQNISIQYLPEEERHIFLTASACMQIIRLPTIHRSKDAFYNAMDVAIKHGALGFPNP